MSESVIYFIERKSDKAIKIGVSKHIKNRLSAIKREHGRIKLLGVIAGSAVREKVLHWAFSSARLDGEFFQPTDELKGLIDQYAIPMVTKPKPTLRRRDTQSVARVSKKQKTVSLRVELTQDEIDNLRRKAAEAGYVLTTTKLAGQGSIRQFLKAIAAGDILIIPNPQRAIKK